MPPYSLAKALAAFTMMLLFSLAAKAQERTDSLANSRNDTISLGEASVTATRMLFVTKKDTVAYNLDALMADQGETLSDVVARLPGMELRNGTLYFKGRKVNRLLIGGNDFVREDTKTALTNIPAYIVKSLKAYERKSDQARVTGIDDGVREQVVDIVLKKKYQGSWTGNADLGYGTDNYWTARAFANTFTERMRISVFGGMTNTGEYQYVSGNGDWGDASGANPATTYKRPGINFSWQNKCPENKQGFVSISANADFNYSSQNIASTENNETFLDSGSRSTASRSWQHSSRKPFSAQLNLQWSPTDSTYVSFYPSASFSGNSSSGGSNSGTWNGNPFDFSPSPLDSLASNAGGWPSGMAANSSQALNAGNGDGYSYSHYFYATHKLNAKNMRLSIRQQFGIDRNGNSSNSLTRYEYYASHNEMPSLINRYNDNSSHAIRQTTYVDFYLPLGKSLMANLSYSNSYDNDRSSNYAFRLDRLGGTFADFLAYSAMMGQLPTQAGWQLATREAEATLYSRNAKKDNSAVASLQFDHKGIHASMRLETDFANERLDYQRGDMDMLRLKRRFVQKRVSSQVRYESDSIGNFLLSYDYGDNAPSLLSTISIPDTDDPLNISTGNPDLKFSASHSVVASYDRNFKNMSYLTFGANWNVEKNSQTSARIYDKQTGVTTTMPVNVSGRWTAGLSSSFSSPLDKKQRWNISLYANYYFNHYADFSTSSSQQLTRNSIGQNSLGGYLSLSFRTVKFQSSLSYSPSLSWQKSTAGSSTEQKSVSNQISWRTDWQLPLRFKISSRFDVSQRSGNSQIEENVRSVVSLFLQRTFFKADALTLKLECSDIFNQRDISNSWLTSSSRGYYHTNSVGRYFMLHAVYKFVVGGKK